MINRIFLMGILLVCFATTTIAQNYTEANLMIDYEDVDSDGVLTASTEEMLQTLLENVTKEGAIVQIELTAHAANRTIGESRLEPFALFFNKQKIKAEKVKLVTQVDDNNQVHIQILVEPTSEALTTVEQTIEPLKGKVYCTGKSKKAEVFVIPSHSNIDIKGKEGTEVLINRHDLMYEDGQAVQEPIRVELKEFYKTEDILRAELHTMEGDQVLETGGMLNLKITANEKPLELKRGKSAKIKMPAQTAKNKEGMNLYFGKRMPNGAVDWRLEERPTPIANPTVSNSRGNTEESVAFNPSSYIQLKKTSIIDSITSKLKVHVKAKHAISNNYPNYSREKVVHSHEEEYFDLELPYLNPDIVDGIWLNADYPIRDPFAPKPVDIMVQIESVPHQGRNIDGEWMSYKPTVALMLKNQAVFLRGNMELDNPILKQQKMKFSDVPKNEEVILVAFLDTGKELLFASYELTATKDIEIPPLHLKSMSKIDFDDAMASIAN